MDPELWELFEEGDGGDEVAAILRLSQSGLVPEGVRIVAQLGEIVTVRMRRGAIEVVREDADVTSMKSGGVAFGPDLEANEDAEEAAGEMRASDERRPADLAATGKGVVVGVVDWGFDFAHPDFRREDGSSRITALWDQRGAAGPDSPMPYGYGRLQTNQALNRALESDDPYAALGYHPADMDPGSGAHGTHVASIAAGSGGAGGPLGVAPDAELVLVHSATWGRDESLGDSVTLLEAIDFIFQTAGDKPCVINLSMGRHGGQHDGSTLVEQGLDAALRAAPGRAICQSTGNYFDRRIHAEGQLRPGTEHTLVWEIAARDATPNQLEVWYSWRDRMEIEIRSPDGTITRRVKLGERAPLTLNGEEIGKVYHRTREPNTFDNNAAVFLYKNAPPGPWEVTLIASNVVDGRFHVWIERDAACPSCQSHFRAEDAIQSGTTGTICNGLRTIAVGAYDPHDPQQPVAHFSSAGPTRDGRIKPDLCAPGVSILAARSTPRAGAASLLTRMSGTSMAAPHVTGTVALMFEVARRRLRIEETHSLLLASTRPPPAEWTGRAGSGYLDIEAAVEAARQFAPRRGEPQSSDGGEESVMKNEYPHSAGEPAPCHECAARRTAPQPPDSPRDTPRFVHRAETAISSGRVRHSAALLGETFTRLGTQPSLDDLTAALLFDLFSAGVGVPGFQLIGAPGQVLYTEPQPGDVFCRRGEGGLAHTALVAGADFWPREFVDAAGLGAESRTPGLYVQVVEGGGQPHTSGDCFARRLTDAEGRIPSSQMLLRPLRGGFGEALLDDAEAVRTDPDYIRWIQLSLNQLIGAQLAVDGSLGPLTRGATRHFQQGHGLVVDGVVGPLTEGAMIAAGAPLPPGLGGTPGARPPAPSSPRIPEVPGGGSAPAPVIKTLRVVVKSFIAPIGSRAGSATCTLPLFLPPPAPPFPVGADVRLRAFAAATDAAMSENPLTDRPTGDSRLFSESTFQIICGEGQLLTVNPSPLRTAVGPECLPPFGNPCLTPPPMVVVSPVTVTPTGPNTFEFSWAAKGRPPVVAEPGFLAVCPRTSVFIWHRIVGEVTCDAAGVRLTRFSFTGSRFPSHRLFVNGVAVHTIPQDEMRNLWIPDPADRSLVAG